METNRFFLRSFLFAACAGLAAGEAQAVSEDVFLKPLPASESIIGIGRSALWTLPHVATQYQPLQRTPEIQAALQAQQEGRFIEALMLLEEAGKSGQASADTKAEIALLRASFLLQGNQSREAAEILAPLLSGGRHAADAQALTAMALLQQGQMQPALEAANRAKDLQGGLLAHLALSYVLQGEGRLAEAREAELALTLDEIQAALELTRRAQQAEASHPYVDLSERPGLPDKRTGQRSQGWV